MSQNPNTFGAAYVPPSFSPPASDHLGASHQKLKSSTKTIAILFLVFGFIGVFSSIFQPLAALVAGALVENAEQPNEDLQRASTQLSAVFSPANLFILSLSFFASLAMIVGGIGTLRRKHAGATLLKYTAGALVPLTVLQTAVGLYYQLANKEQVLQNAQDQFNQPGAAEMPAGIETFMEIGFYVGIGVSIIVGLAFLALYLWAFLHMSKASTMAQFDSPSMHRS